jgi:hypothetical protein
MGEMCVTARTGPPPPPPPGPSQCVVTLERQLGTVQCTLGVSGSLQLLASVGSNAPIWTVCWADLASLPPHPPPIVFVTYLLVDLGGTTCQQS